MVEIPYFSITDVLPEFDKHSIIYQLYAQMNDPFENIDDAKFIRINLPL